MGTLKHMQIEAEENYDINEVTSYMHSADEHGFIGHDGFTYWEYNFIMGLDGNDDLTDSQRQKVNEIGQKWWDEVEPMVHFISNSHT